MSEPTTFKDVPEDVKAKARALAITVLNMGDVDMVTGFMAGVLFHASNTLIEEQAARIAELEKELAHSDSLFRALQSSTTDDIKAFSASQARLSEAVKVLEAYLNEYEGVYDMAATKERPAHRSDGAKAAEDAARNFLATLEEEN